MFTPDTNTSYLQHGENQKKRTNLRERGKEEEEEEEEEEEIKKSNYPHNNHGKKCRLLAALYPHTTAPVCLPKPLPQPICRSFTSNLGVEAAEADGKCLEC
jgi:hypothetical protein